MPNVDIAQLQAQFPGLTGLQSNEAGVQVDPAQLQAQFREKFPNAETKIKKAQAFLKDVETELGGTEHPLYIELISAFQKFRNEELDTQLFLKQFMENFHAFPDIVRGMNEFVPGYDMEITSGETKKLGRLVTPKETVEFPVGQTV